MVATVVLDSAFPLLTLIILTYLPPISSYALTLLFATLFLLLFGFWRGNMVLVRAGVPPLLIASALITLMFSLIFIGLTTTSATHAAVLIFCQLFFAFIYFNLAGGEPIPKHHLLGALLMAVGALVILVPTDWEIVIGDGLILLAAAIAPWANLYQKRARCYLSAELILAFRSLMALPVLLLLMLWLEPWPEREAVVSALPWLVINGVLMMGVAKIFWIEAISAISITKASAMTAWVPVLTLFLVWLLFNEPPTGKQLAGMVPVVIGGWLITQSRPLR